MATIASLLRERVTLQVNSVDRIFLAGYTPKLQSEGMLVRFLLDRRFPIPSPAALGKVGAAYVRAIERFAARNRIPVVHFKKGESKELRARRYIHKAEREGRFGVVMIGVAQEKTSARRGFKAGGSASHPHLCYRRMSVFPNHFYIYIRDREFGPAFIKTVGYAPYGVWIYLNGHEWAKRQAAKRGIAFEALDNGFRSVEDADALAGICDTFYYRDLERFWEYWQARLPSPLSAQDRERGYGYRLSIRQLEPSDTRLRELVAGLIPGYSARQMTYDLRRLRRKGLIRRIDASQQYQLTDYGQRIAVFFTKTYTRILNPSLPELDPTLPDETAQHSPLARAWRAFEHALDARIADAHPTV